VFDIWLSMRGPALVVLSHLTL